MGNTNPWAATNRRASLISLDKLQAASRKQQAASFKLRQSVIYAPDTGMVIWSRAARELVSTIRYKPCEACIRGEAGSSSQTTKGDRYESYNRSRMEMAGRTGPSFGRRSYEGPEGGWIRSRKDLHSGTSPGGQTKNKIQRRGPAATRRGSVSGFPHLRKNVIITAPVQLGPSSCIPSRSHKPQATSLKRQAAQGASGKLQASSSKPQASSRKRQAQEPCVLHKVSRS